MELENHDMWNDQTWLVRSSPSIPSNFGMCEGSLVSIEGKPTSWCIGLFINSLRSSRLNPAIKGSMGAVRTVHETISPHVTITIELEPTQVSVHAPAVG